MHDSHQKAAEYHILAVHAHRTAAEHQGQECLGSAGNGVLLISDSY